MLYFRRVYEQRVVRERGAVDERGTSIQVVAAEARRMLDEGLERLLSRTEDDDLTGASKLLFTGFGDRGAVSSNETIRSGGEFRRETPGSLELFDSGRGACGQRPSRCTRDLVEERGDDHRIDCLQSVAR